MSIIWLFVGANNIMRFNGNNEYTSMCLCNHCSSSMTICLYLCCTAYVYGAHQHVICVHRRALLCFCIAHKMWLSDTCVPKVDAKLLDALCCCSYFLFFSFIYLYLVAEKAGKLHFVTLVLFFLTLFFCCQKVMRALHIKLLRRLLFMTLMLLEVLRVSKGAQLKFLQFY